MDDPNTVSIWVAQTGLSISFLKKEEENMVLGMLKEGREEHLERVRG